jgi:hypothetical protein
MKPVCIRLLFLCIVFPAAAVNAPSALAADAEPIKHHREAIVERLSKVQSIVATFRQETTYTLSPDPDVVALVRGQRANGQHPFEGLYIEQGQFSFLRQQAIYDVTYAPETVQRFQAENAAYLKHTVKTYARDRAESLVVHSKSGHAAGKISDSQKLPDEYPIDVALGLRCNYEQVWLDQSRLASANLNVTDNGLVWLEMPDIDAQGAIHRLQFNPNAGYALVECQYLRNDGFVLAEIECDDFSDYGGLILPMLVKARYMQQSQGRPFTVRSIKLVAMNYSINGSTNTPDRYHLSYPAGALIHESRFDVPLHTATTKSFSDREIFEAAQARDARSGRPSRTPFSRLTWLFGSTAIAALIVLYLYKYHRWTGRGRVAVNTAGPK